MPFTSETARQAGAVGKRGLGDRAKLLGELYNPKKAREVWAKLESMALAGEMDAIKTYLAYLWGKPKESMDLNMPAGINIIFKKVEQENNIHLLPMSNGTTNGTGN